MKLYELPRNSKMRLEFEEDGEMVWHDCLFHHTDGMYSYCTIEDSEKDDGTKAVFHLGVLQEMEKIGDHYEIAAQEAIHGNKQSLTQQP